MDKQDLTLVSMNDLIGELEKRCSCIIIAYETFEEKQKLKIAQFVYGKGTQFAACRLSNILNNDVLNNWNGELQTLQRINDDE